MSPHSLREVPEWRKEKAVMRGHGKLIQIFFCTSAERHTHATCDFCYALCEMCFWYDKEKDFNVSSFPCDQTPHLTWTDVTWLFFLLFGKSCRADSSTSCTAKTTKHFKTLVRLCCGYTPLTDDNHTTNRGVSVLLAPPTPQTFYRSLPQPETRWED